MANLPILKLFTGFFKIIIMFIGAWFLVHFFALLGVFVSIAHVILWSFFPKSAICVSCLSKRDGEYCKVCKKTKDKTEGTHPKSFLSVVYTSVLFLLVSILSVGIVYLESKLLNQVLHPVSEKTVSFVIPSKNQYKTGEIFGMDIKLSGIETPINAIQADIGFDRERLEVVDISTKGSFATVFLQKEYNNDLGYARLSGGLPNPGYNAPEGHFGTIYFKSKLAGLAQVFYLDSSLVLANDGKGTNVIKEYSTVSYLITPDLVPQDVQDLQHSLLLDDILGVQDESEEQILLFETSDTNVLGIEDFNNLDIKGTEIQEGDSLGHKFLHLLESFDNFILSVLREVFTFFDSQIFNLFRKGNE